MARVSIEWIAALALAVGACASTQTAPLAEADLAAQTIREAEATGAAASPQAAESLARARSQVDYAHHLPGDPEHARRLYMRAQVDAELAIVQARVDAQRRRSARRASSFSEAE